ncbi:hypothetical protein ACFW04_010508 [Cataglyphis niger]
MLKSIQLLLQFRKDAKVHSSNSFLFGLSSINNKRHYKHLRACRLMRDFASECGTKNISTLRGTILRKHVVTKCIYKQPVAKIDILEMSKILEKVLKVWILLTKLI